MTNTPYIKAAIAQASLEFVSPLIRKTLIEDSKFREEYGFEADFVISIGEKGFSAKNSELLNAIRRLYSGGSEKKVRDIEGKNWRLKIINEEGESPKFTLSRYKKQIALPDFFALSPESRIRMRSFEEAASEVNLPKYSKVRWREILANRTLNNDEIETFFNEFRITPITKANAIHDEIVRGQSRLSSLVPPFRNYFEQLIGVYDGSASIWEYAANGGKAFLRELFKWRSYEGLFFSLLLSSHSSMTNEISTNKITKEEIIKAFEYFDKHGDRVSQIGIIEVGLRLLKSAPEIEPILIRLIKLIRDDDCTGQGSGFKLLSALFALVDGELSRIRLFTKEPPFYRRLASLAQSALIQRQLVGVGVDIDTFHEQALNDRAWQFYLQSLVDMRIEPRWNPDFASAVQLKADFLGRIVIAARNNEQNIKSSELTDLVLGTKPGVLRSIDDYIGPFLPGPLEGTAENQNILPSEIADSIEQQLGSEIVGPSSFIALVNSALIYNLDTDQAELAAKVLKLGSHRLTDIENKSQLLSILYGLATAAAVSRSHSLANELRILERRYRYDSQYALTLIESVRICLVAAASRTDLNDWQEFVGDWLTEIAFSDLEGDDCKILSWQLRYLCHIVPELWLSCGRGDAALIAYNDIKK